MMADDDWRLKETPEYQTTLRWRHNEWDGVSNHQPHDCLLNRLSGRRSKKTSKPRVTGLCAGNSPGTGEFPAQMASNAKTVSIWWRHHVSPNIPVNPCLTMTVIFVNRCQENRTPRNNVYKSLNKNQHLPWNWNAFKMSSDLNGHIYIHSYPNLVPNLASSPNDFSWRLIFTDANNIAHSVM